MRGRHQFITPYIFLSFIIAIALTIIPLPQWAVWLRPSWIALLVIFWALYAPESCGIITVWVVGLLMDALQFGLLGEHGLALVIVYYLARKMTHQIITYPVPMQMMRIGLILLVNQAVIATIHGVIGDLTYTKMFLLPVITSVLFWPIVVYFLRSFKTTSRAYQY